MMMPRHLPTLMLALLLLNILLILPATATAADTSLSVLMDAVRKAPTPEQRTQAFYRLSTALREGTPDLDLETADDLARLLIEVMLGPDSSHERTEASSLAARFPHPLMADPLAEYLAEHPDDPFHVKRDAVVVLAGVKDHRVIDLLAPDLASDEDHIVVAAVGRLADSGDPAAIALLKALLDEPSLEERYAKGFVRRRLEVGNDTDPQWARRHGEQGAREVRTAARTALRKLEFQDQTGIACSFDLEQDFLARLASDGFVIPPHPMNEMYEIYHPEYPFVTTDFAYHTAMILVRAGLDEIEDLWLAEALGSFCRDMSLASIEQAERADDPEDAGLARRNAAFFAVPAVLCGACDLAGLDLGDAEPGGAAELARVRAGVGLIDSELLGRKEDYSEYVPRGRFSHDSHLSGYFQAFTWLGRGVFRAKDPGETRQGLLAIEALLGDPLRSASFGRIDDILSFLGGEPDDPTPADYLRLAETVSGNHGLSAVRTVLDDPDLLGAFRRAASALPPPRIHTGTDADRHGALGLRILGQRYSQDAHLFQFLMEDRLWPPSGLHILAGLLDSPRARDRLGGPIPLPPGMPEGLGSSLMDGFLDCFGSTLATDAALPEPFASPAWQDKQINSALGAWAETRHAAAPYLKAAHLYVGFSAMTGRLHGFVEPYPEFFRRLAGRMMRLHGILNTTGIYEAIEHHRQEVSQDLDAEFGAPDQYGKRPSQRDYQEVYQKELGLRRLGPERLTEFIGILERLAELAVKCRDGIAQDPGDGVFLKALGDRMRRISFNESSSPVAEESMARIIDVATEYQSGQVLEAGVGKALPIYVAVSDGERRIVCRGAVYSYYEFTVPLGERLDDGTWDCLSSRLEGPRIQPWLDSACGLVTRAELSRGDIIPWLDSLGKGNHGGVMHQRPWVFRLDSNLHTAPWVGARTANRNVDLLLELASGDRLEESLDLFVIEELRRMSAEVPDALAFFRDVADRLPERRDARRTLMRPPEIRRYLMALEVLAASGAEEDQARLDKALGLLDMLQAIGKIPEAMEPCLMESVEWALCR